MSHLNEKNMEEVFNIEIPNCFSWYSDQQCWYSMEGWHVNQLSRLKRNVWMKKKVLKKSNSRLFSLLSYRDPCPTFVKGEQASDLQQETTGNKLSWKMLWLRVHHVILGQTAACMVFLTLYIWLLSVCSIVISLGLSRLYSFTRSYCWPFSLHVLAKLTGHVWFTSNKYLCSDLVSGNSINDAYEKGATGEAESQRIYTRDTTRRQTCFGNNGKATKAK